ncbi:MAG: hypothetical protein P8182_04655 [Deltaproteobacteria bacterium]
MYGWLVPHIIFPLHERVTRHNFWSGFLELRELQWRSPKELEARSFHKLSHLVSHAYENVPYYRELFETSGIKPHDLTSTSDLAFFPVTTRFDLRRNYPDKVIASNLDPGRRVVNRTSGSTGSPFEFYADLGGMDLVRSSYLLFWDWAGIGPWTPEVRIANSAHFFCQSPQKDFATRTARRILMGERHLLLHGADLTLAEFRDRVHSFSAGGQYYVWSFSSYAKRLASQIVAEGTQLSRYPLVFISYAETLTPTDQELIEQAFRCKVVNHYGLLETPFVAQVCPDNPAVFHVNSERVIVRIVRDGGASAAPGERGRVVITDLSNYVMPFINYDTGDLAVAGARCHCGRGLPTVERIEGRMSEAIQTPMGNIVPSPTLQAFLNNVCLALPHIWEYQAVQTAMDRVVLRIVPTSSFTPTVSAKLKKDLEEFLGPGLAVAVEAVSKIEFEPSGKRPLIKSELTAR